MHDHDSKNDDKIIKALYKKSPFLSWGRLRFVGSVRVISVMSFVGASVAAGLSLPQLSKVNISHIISDNRVIWSLLGFFICLLVSNLMHYIFCPAIIKKFSSLADFYMHQINIKKCQMETYPNDQFDASMLHVSKQYIKDLSSKPCARWLSLILFAISIVCFFAFAVNLYSVLVSDNEIKSSSTAKHTISFEYNKSDLNDSAKRKLDDIAKSVKDTNRVVIIKGYTDNSGSTEYNQKLSVERANKVMRYLTENKNISELNVEIVGYGSLWPVAPNSTEDDRKFNRRVEIEIFTNNK